jgi:hypothetical protein
MLMYTTDKPERTGIGEGTGEHPHIWLRYATQFTTAGRTHTIEMGIPVPVGATAEMRAQLIREAEVGMDQLSSYVESRVTQMLQRNQRPQSTTPPSLAASSAPKPISKPPTGSSPASTPATQDITAQETQKTAVPPTRTHVGASMPLAPGLPGDANAALTLTQFLHFIKGTLGLTHQQAKDLLQVQTLNGLNLREALERLQRLIAQNTAGSTTPEQKPQEPQQSQPLQRPAAPSAPTPMPLPAASARPSLKPATNPGPSSTPQSTAPVPLKPLATTTGPGSSSSPGTPGTSSTSTNTPIDLSTRRSVNDQRPTYKFDEEDDLDEDLAFDDLDDSEARPALSAEDRLRARTILSKMKDIRGSTASSEGRLKVLHNVISTQITPEQLQQLLQAFWGTNTPKKLKADQVEELISWAKEDEFANEVEAVLTVLEEE